MTKVTSIRDKQIERMGQEMGDAFVMYAKLYFTAIDTITDIVELAKNNEVNERVIAMEKELVTLEKMYTSMLGTEQ